MYVYTHVCTHTLIMRKCFFLTLLQMKYACLPMANTLKRKLVCQWYGGLTVFDTLFFLFLSFFASLPGHTFFITNTDF